MKLLYFAWLRQHVGVSEENVSCPPGVETVGQLVQWLAGRGHRRAADWIVRVMVSFVLMPSTVIDLDDPKAVRAFVQEFIVNGLGPAV